MRVKLKQEALFIGAPAIPAGELLEVAHPSSFSSEEAAAYARERKRLQREGRGRRTVMVRWAGACRMLTWPDDITTAGER